MRSITDKSVNLPPAHLVPGRDDDLLEWRIWAIENNVNLSATIREALRDYWQRRNGKAGFEAKIVDRLDKIEALLRSGADAVPKPKNEKFNDPFLDGAL